MSDVREQWRRLVRSYCAGYARPATPEVWAPELECCPAARYRAIQGEKLALAYRYLWECSGFYRRKFEAAGLAADSVDGVDDLAKIPLTHREEWLEDQERHPPWGTFSPLRHEDWLERGWMLFTTSGTTARFPRVFRHTTFDRDVWTYYAARSLYAMGVRRGDVALNCFAYGTAVAFWVTHYGLAQLGVPVIPGGGANTERRILLVENYRPTVLMCTPSYALYMGRTMQELGKSPEESSIRLVCCAGEPGASVPATKRRVEQLWGAKMGDYFGCTEVAMPPLGYTCSHQIEKQDGEPAHAHINEDAYIVEVLDRESFEPLPDGQPGILAVTNLYSEAQPIPRYVMGDWITVERRPCPCGRTQLIALGGLRGRDDKLVKIRGLTFFPAAIEDALRSLPEVGDEFRVEIDRVADMDQIRAIIEPGEGTPGMSDRERIARVAARLKGTLQIRFQVEVVPPGSLERTQYKADRVIDKRPKPSIDPT